MDKKGIWKMDKGYGILVICATILVLSFVGTASARTWIVDDDGGGDFLGIQEAINNASVGDTIIVHSGVYYENVYVNKSVTLKGIGQPVVDANGSGSAITLNADGITLEGLNATNSGRWEGAGIRVISSNNTITGNNVSNNKYGGIYLYNSSNNNTITGNTFVNDSLRVDDPYQNTVEGNIVNGKPLVYLEDASDYTVEDAGQVILVNCDNITVENRDLSNTDVGIELWKTENSRISNNKVSNNNVNGISLFDSSNNTITGNNASNNNANGISLREASNNTITGNNASNNNANGIWISGSSNNTITGNNVRNNSIGGIQLFRSSNNTITGNTFVNDGLSVDDSYQNTVEENKVNGKPLVYLEDASDYTVEDAGQVIVVNCTNITVENLDLSNTSVGVELWGGEDSIISNNTVSNNENGISLFHSTNNTITGNNVSNNNGGIYLDSSSNNTVTGNNVSNNSIGGIHLFRSNNNTITGNTFVNDGLMVYGSYQNTVEGNIVNDKSLIYLEDASDYKVEDAGQVILVNCANITVENLDLSSTSVGIELWNTEDSTISNNKVCNNSMFGIILSSSGSNGIYLNNIINNTDNVDSYASTNIWNSTEKITYTYLGTTYESCLGNYWDDYEGSDADGDGIGDTHYRMDSEEDDYPLMKPFENYIT